MKDPNRYPPGWDLERVQSLIEFYDSQTSEEAIAGNWRRDARTSREER